MQLGDPEVLKRMQERYKAALAGDDQRAALVFVRNVDDVVSQEVKEGSLDESVARKYYAMQKMMRYVALPSLGEQEVVRMFKESITQGLQEPRINMREKLVTLMLTIPSFASRDQLRKQLQQALRDNEERIGENQIMVSNKNEYPTISNWLRKYISLYGNTPVNAVQLNQFFTSDADAQKLQPDEQRTLRELVDVYEYLKLSSQTPEGLEDPLIVNINGERKVLRGDRFEDIKLSPEAQKIVDEVFAQLNKKESKNSGQTRSSAPSFALSKIIEGSHQLLEQTNGEAGAVRDSLYQNIGAQKRDAVLSALLLLAQLGQLDQLLVADERFRKIVEDDLRAAAKSDKLDGLRVQPGAPHFLAQFLKHILQDSGLLQQQEALSFAYRLNAFLNGISVVTDTSGAMRWNL